MANENEVVFEPKGGVKGLSGSFALPGGKTFDIGKRLKSSAGGKNRIATSDPVEIDGLDRVEQLKRASGKKKSAPKAAAGRSAAPAGGDAGSADSTDTNGGNA